MSARITALPVIYITGASLGAVVLNAVQQPSQRHRTHRAPPVKPVRGCCYRSPTPSGSQKGPTGSCRSCPVCFASRNLSFLALCSSPANRARGEGCSVILRQIAASYSLTFLLLTKQLTLSIKQPSQPTNGLSQEERDRRHGMIASGRANNEGKEDLTVL